MTTIQQPNAAAFHARSIDDLPTLEESIAFDQDEANSASMRRAYRAGALIRAYAETACIGHDGEIQDVAAMVLADVMHMCDVRHAAMLQSDDPEDVDQAYRHGFDEIVECGRIIHRHELGEI